MPPPNQDDVPSSPASNTPPTMSLPKIRAASAADGLKSPRIHSPLPIRASNPSVASLYASTLSPPGSRSMSPAGRSPSRMLASAVFDGGQGHSLPEDAGDNPGEPLSLILKAFVPHVAVYASEDTEELLHGKGFKDGLWELLRPFGERVQGKVTVRDSNGVGRVSEDFAIRFTRFGHNIEHPDPKTSGQMQLPQSEAKANAKEDRKVLDAVETLVERHLSYAEGTMQNTTFHDHTRRHSVESVAASPYYALYLRRLLSGFPITAHETFAHPVACVVAISSRNENPIEELRRLYAETNQGDKKLPPWVDSEYLRYYVLVHDEENGDITRSMSLFEQMKRHLGLHCHLLRLRSTQAAETDDDNIPLPRSDWMTASEELEDITNSENDAEFEAHSHYIFESDATAIRTFVREMVTQSIVPTMERHMTVWNDQVASRRRGLTGKFMSLSKRWTGFGSSSSRSGGAAATKDGYDPAGFYYAAAPESVMRKLADFAFMLRDWKLAYSTYDLLRSDFSESKAWKYHAAANEMAALSLLLIPQNLTSKTRTETIDPMLESAYYSYNTRCSSPYGALRSLLLGLELLKLRGGSNIDDAGRWGLRLLESKTVGSVGDALVKERLAISYGSKTGVGSWSWGSRRRKSAAWSVLAAETWLQQAKYIPAYRCLQHAQDIYQSTEYTEDIGRFSHAQSMIDALQRELTDRLDMYNDGGADAGDNDIQDEIEEESEALTDLHARRASISRGGLETAPLHGEDRQDAPEQVSAQEGFD